MQRPGHQDTHTRTLRTYYYQTSGPGFGLSYLYFSSVAEAVSLLLKSRHPFFFFGSVDHAVEKDIGTYG